MLDLIRWYVVVQLIGVAALPLCARAFRGLPDRGYAFARPVGLLVVGVALWMGAIYGLWPNTGATVALLTVALAGVSWFALPRAADEVRRLWRDERSRIWAIEGLFLAAFLFWAFCRSQFPNIEATEKPMEFAFLNGILRSPWFPPADPWLSGYSISYYYLGYVMVAALTEFSGVIAAVAFNLAIATLFALTITGAFALGSALVEGLGRTWRQSAGVSEGDGRARTWPAWWGGALAAFFVGFFGNLEGFLELLYAHGVGSAAFWRGLAVWGLVHPNQSPTWYPNEAVDNWWWFRASRVVLDYPFGGTPPQNYNTINEFPFFSFLLGDLHPHLLALPYAFVCLGFALSFLRTPGEFRLSQLPRRLGDVGFDFAFIAFLFGAMFLLNAWDILTYLFVLVCAFAVRAYLSRPHFDLVWLGDTALFGIASLIAGVALYWPFYVTFQSQATGLLGVVQNHSHLEYFLLFWAPFLFLVGSMVTAELLFRVSPIAGRMPVGPSWTRSPITWGAVVVLAVLAWFGHAPALTLLIPLLIGALALAVRYLAGVVRLAEGTDRADADWRLPEQKQPTIAGGAAAASVATEHLFVMILIFVAALLLFGTEIVYIKDAFDNRMNTVFKLYFQSWEMLAVAAAYAVYYLGNGWSRRSRGIPTAAASGSVRETKSRTALPRPVLAGWAVIGLLLVVGSFVYVPMALFSRSDAFSHLPTLDGLAYYQQSQPADAAGIAWLAREVQGTPTIVEASGGSYSQFAEVSWMTGIPTILGWDFHEIQWHGESIVPVVNQRKQDIQTIYTTTDARQAESLLREYHVQYVYVGPLEQEKFGSNPAALDKFRQFMDVVYQNPGVTIYRLRGGS